MSTTQQVGYALGVAITGVIFFGVGEGHIARAFELGLIQLAVLAAGIVVMARLLPDRGGNETASIRSESDGTLAPQTDP